MLMHLAIKGCVSTLGRLSSSRSSRCGFSLSSSKNRLCSLSRPARQKEDAMSKTPEIRAYDPAVKELLRLVELPALEECPTEIKDGVKKALELAAMRDRFCEQVSSKSKTLQQVQQFTVTHDWKKVKDEGKTEFSLSPQMMSGTLEGQFLKMLVSMQKPRRVLELGMYTGCGAVAMAEALPADGTLVTIDREPYLREVTQQFYDSFPQGKRIQVKIGQVKEIMRGLLAEGQQFDLIFIDADKPGYVDYYKIAMDKGLLAPGGTIVADNAFRGGSSYTGPQGDLQGNPMRVFIDHVNSDPRVESVLVPLRDGVMIIRRKEDITE